MARWVNVGIGLWLIAAGMALAGPDSPAQLVNLAAGAALTLVAVATRPGSAEGLAAILLGACLMVAPAALGYADVVNALVDVLTGLAVVAVGLQPHLARRLAARRALRA
jgi:hypothetical protein